jgi:hypothetical protein
LKVEELQWSTPGFSMGLSVSAANGRQITTDPIRMACTDVLGSIAACLDPCDYLSRVG